jgi:large subunit ribosomal protein L21
MYAVIKAGGKQHRVKAGDVIEVELVHGQPGDAVEFHPLLVVDDDGKAYHGKDVARALVVGRLVGEQKGDKVKVFKYRPKTGYSRRQGHRQLMTLLEIEDVRLGARPAASKKAEERPEPEEADASEAGQAAEAAEAAEPAEKPAPKRQTARAAAVKPAAEEAEPADSE